MDQSNTGVTEYYGYVYNGGKKFPYYFNFEKCKIKWLDVNYMCYKVCTYITYSKNKVYKYFAKYDRYNREIFAIRNSNQTIFVVGYRSLFKIINDEIIPIAIIDHNLNIHIQSDIFVDRWEKGLLKMIVSQATGEVTLYDNLAGEFFLHPNARFKNLKEKKVVEDMLTAKLVARFPKEEIIVETEESVAQRIDEILGDIEFEEVEEEMPF